MRLTQAESIVQRDAAMAMVQLFAARREEESNAARPGDRSFMPRFADVLRRGRVDDATGRINSDGMTKRQEWLINVAWAMIASGGPVAAMVLLVRLASRRTARRERSWEDVVSVIEKQCGVVITISEARRTYRNAVPAFLAYLDKWDIGRSYTEESPLSRQYREASGLGRAA